MSLEESMYMYISKESPMFSSPSIPFVHTKSKLHEDGKNPNFTKKLYKKQFLYL